MASSMNRYYKPSGTSKGHFSNEPPEHYSTVGGPSGAYDASRMTTSTRDEPSVSASNASEVESEWIEEDEPGVYITIRQLVDGTRELRRVRFR